MFLQRNIYLLFDTRVICQELRAASGFSEKEINGFRNKFEIAKEKNTQTPRSRSPFPPPKNKYLAPELQYKHARNGPERITGLYDLGHCLAELWLATEFRESIHVDEHDS